MLTAYLNNKMYNRNLDFSFECHLYLQASLNQKEQLCKIQSVFRSKILEQKKVQRVEKKLALKQKIHFKLNRSRNTMEQRELHNRSLNNSRHAIQAPLCELLASRPKVERIKISSIFPYTLDFQKPYNFFLNNKTSSFNFLIDYSFQTLSQTIFAQMVATFFTVNQIKKTNASRSAHTNQKGREVKVSPLGLVSSFFFLSARSVRDSRARFAKPEAIPVIWGSHSKQMHTINKQTSPFLFPKIFLKNQVLNSFNAETRVLKTKTHFIEKFTRLFFIEFNQSELGFNSNLSLVARDPLFLSDVFCTNHFFIVVHRFFHLFLSFWFKGAYSPKWHVPHVEISIQKDSNIDFFENSQKDRGLQRISFFLLKIGLQLSCYNLLEELYTNLLSKKSFPGAPVLEARASYKENFKNLKPSINKSLKSLIFYFSSKNHQETVSQISREATTFQSIFMLKQTQTNSNLTDPFSNGTIIELQLNKSLLASLPSNFDQFEILKYKNVLENLVVFKHKKFTLILNFYNRKNRHKFFLLDTPCTKDIYAIKPIDLVNFLPANTFCRAAPEVPHLNSYLQKRDCDLFGSLYKYPNKNFFDFWSYCFGDVNESVFFCYGSNLRAENKLGEKWDKWIAENWTFFFTPTNLDTKNKSKKIFLLDLYSKNLIKQKFLNTLSSQDLVTNHFLMNFKMIVKNSSSLSQSDLILKLTGLMYSYSYFCKNLWNLKTIQTAEKEIFNCLWKWSCRRHNNKSKKWIQEKYFYQLTFNTWVFRCFEDSFKSKSFSHFSKSATHLFSSINVTQEGSAPPNVVYLPSLSQIVFHLNKSLQKN